MFMYMFASILLCFGCYRPLGEISLSCMNRFMMDYFSPIFPIILTEYIKPENINFTRNLTTPVCLLGPKMDENSLHLQNGRKSRFEHSFL